MEKEQKHGVGFNPAPLKGMNCHGQPWRVKCSNSGQQNQHLTIFLLSKAESIGPFLFSPVCAHMYVNAVCSSSLHTNIQVHIISLRSGPTFQLHVHALQAGFKPTCMYVHVCDSLTPHNYTYGRWIIFKPV